MKLNKHLKTVLLASLVTAATTLALNYSAVLVKLCNVVQCDNRTIVIVAMAIYLAAGIPGLFIMWPLRPRTLAVTVFATLEAFWLSFGLVPLLFPIGWWALISATSILIIAMYIGTDLAFDRWKTRFRYKAIAAMIIVAVTAVASDRIAALLVR